MVLSDKHKFIFLHVPKTGGSSVRTVLLLDLLAEKLSVHSNATQARNILKEKWAEYTKFAFVRNPYSRVVSWYNHVLHEAACGKRKDFICVPDSFETFVKKQEFIYVHRKNSPAFTLWSTQKDFMSINGRIAVDYVLKYESMQDDFDLLCDKLSIGHFKLPHSKRWGVQNNYDHYYTDELRGIVYDRMKEDFLSFGYEV